MQPSLDIDSTPPPPVYALPPKASFPRWGKVLLGCGCLLIAFVVLIGFGFSRFIVGNRGMIQSSFCLQNLRSAQRGIDLYSQDYDETLPRSAAWMDDMSPYLKNRTELKCPIVRVANPQGFGYAFNSKLSAAKTAKIETPSTTAAIYDSSDIARNASDAFTTLPSPPRHVSPTRKEANKLPAHNNLVLYADGHVRLLSADGAATDAPDPNPRRFFGPRSKTK